MKTNKVAIVTGAGSGIGRAAAIRLAADNIAVVVADIDDKSGNETVDMITGNGGRAFFVHADTSSAKDNERLVAEAVNQYGALHIAVNNAGVGGPAAPTGEYPVEGWDKVIAINLSGVFYGMRYQIAEIQKHGGAIVNIASILGSVGTAFSPAYVAAKHGVVGLTKTAAIEYAQKGVRVNSIGPGYIMTPLLTKHLDDEQIKGLEKLHPAGRLGKPEEVAELIAWLASDAASFVTGSYYTVDGGYTAQ